jgi:hypothetical protein
MMCLLDTFLYLSCFEHKISSKPHIDLRNEFIYLCLFFYWFGDEVSWTTTTNAHPTPKVREIVHHIVQNAQCITFCLFMQVVALSTINEYDEDPG